MEKSLSVSSIVYLVKDQGNLSLVKVKSEQEQQFLKDYAGRVLLSGDSIQEVIIRLNELLQSC
jgi:hypothetical protein